MKIRLISTYLLATTTFLCNCTPNSENETNREYLQKSEIEVLNNQLDEIESLCQNLILDKYLVYFHKDAMILPPGQTPKVGIEKIREFLSGFDEVFIPSFVCQYTERKFEIKDSLAVRQYRSFGKIPYKNSADTLISDNRYMDVLKKQTDGSWKIIWQIWNANNSEQ